MTIASATRTNSHLKVFCIVMRELDVNASIHADVAVSNQQ